MEKPTIVQEIEKLLGIELYPAPIHPDKLTGVMVIKNGQAKFAMEGEKLIGLNLAGVGLTDEQLEQVLGKVNTSVLQGLNLNANNLNTISLSKEFPVLQHLEVSDNEQLTEIIFPSILPKLKRLVIRDNKLKRVILPEKLPSVWFIDGSRNKTKKITLGKEMPDLEYMDWSGNELQEFSIPTIYPKMEHLYLMGSEPENIPKEIYDDKKNCWEDIRNFFRELIKDEVVNINYRAKMIVVGNGRVGKTSMLRRIKGEKLNPIEPITHGVQFGDLSKENLEDIKTPKLELNVWDFGGQEIFLATHQFFLSDEAIYILAWTNEKNVLPHRERDKDKLSPHEVWRSNEYWLENIRLHGKESPIIMVQTNSDNRDNRLTIEPIVEKEPYAAHCINFSASKDYGLSELKDVIADKLNNDIPMLGKPFPKSYEDVYKEIIQLQKESATITLDRFNGICIDKGITEGGEHSVLEYLHKTGVVVYFDRPLLSNTVYIDPDWLTNEVYKLINNKLQEKDGEINNKYLQEILPEPEYNQQKRLQFLELLKNFHLIFEEGDFNLSEIDQRVFIAPQYLPARLPRTAQKLFDSIFEEMSLKFIFRFPRFMPDNVMINFLSMYGPYSNKLYWKNGICFKNEKRIRCVVKYHKRNKSLSVFSEEKNGTHSLLKEICDAFTELSKNANAEVSIDEGTTFVSIQELRKNLEACRNNPGHEFYPKSGTELVKVSDYFHLISEENFYRNIEEKVDGRNNNYHTSESMPPIYFSYAWNDKDENSFAREEIVDELYDSLDKAGFELRRDKKDCPFGESIGDFMNEYKEASLVLVFLSEKYFYSKYCMSEIYNIYESKNYKEGDFKKRIIPIVVEDIYPVLSDGKENEQWEDHWDKIFLEAKTSLEKKRVRPIGDKKRRRLEKIKMVAGEVGNLLEMIKDINRGNIDMYKKDNFDLIKSTLQKRLAVVPHLAENKEIQEQLLNKLIWLEERLTNQITKTETSLSNKIDQSNYILIQEITNKHQSLERLINGLSKKHSEELEKVYNKVNNNQFTSEQLQSMSNQITAQIAANHASLPQEIAAQWQAIQESSKTVADLQGKFKCDIMIIPGILSYEKELSFDLKPLVNWAKQYWSKFNLKTEDK